MKTLQFIPQHLSEVLNHFFSIQVLYISNNFYVLQSFGYVQQKSHTYVTLPNKKVSSVLNHGGGQISFLKNLFSQITKAKKLKLPKILCIIALS